MNAKLNVRRLEQMTIRDYYGLIKAGMIDQNRSFQRSARPAWDRQEHIDSVWDSLVDSGYGWGIISLSEDESTGGYWAIDGNHRTRYVAKTLNGLINPLGVNVLDNPDKLEDFLNSLIDFAIYPPMSDEDAADLFERLSGGIDLTNIEKLRGRVVFVLSNPVFISASQALLGVLPSVAGRTPRKESAEEILLQSLSGMMGNRNYAGKDMIAFLVAHENDITVKVLDTLKERVNTFVEWIQGDKSKDEVNRSWFAKTFLNVLFGGDDLPQYNHVSRFMSSKKLDDQNEWKTAAGAGSASIASVSARFAVMSKIIRGGFTFEEKTVKKPKTESPKTESDKKNNTDTGLNLSKTITATWGDKVSDSDVARILAYCAKNELIGFDPFMDRNVCKFHATGTSGKPVSYTAKNIAIKQGVEEQTDKK